MLFFFLLKIRFYRHYAHFWDVTCLYAEGWISGWGIGCRIRLWHATSWSTEHKRAPKKRKRLADQSWLRDPRCDLFFLLLNHKSMYYHTWYTNALTVAVSLICQSVCLICVDEDERPSLMELEETQDPLRAELEEDMRGKATWKLPYILIWWILCTQQQHNLV